MPTSPPKRGASLSNAPTQLRGQRLTNTAFTASCSTCCRSSSTPALCTVSTRAVQPSAGAEKSPSRGDSIALKGESAACPLHGMAASSKNLRCELLSLALHILLAPFLNRIGRGRVLWDRLSKVFQGMSFGGCGVLPGDGARERRCVGKTRRKSRKNATSRSRGE